MEISGQATEPDDLDDQRRTRRATATSDVFPEPEKFVLDRPNITAHLGFGRGRHRCAGMPLARLILKIFLRTMLSRTQDWDVAGELQFARLPEIGIIGCPLKMEV